MTTINNPIFYRLTSNRNEAVDNSINSIAEIDTKIAKLRQQATTEQRYADQVEVGLEGKSYALLNLNKQISQNIQLQQNNDSVIVNVNGTLDLLNSMNEVVNNIQNALVNYNELDPEILKSHLSNIQSILNSRLAGRALFGGYDINDDAVGDIVNNSNLVDGMPTDNYILGSQERFVYKINGNQPINTNIVASDESFKKIIGAVHMALKINNNSTLNERESYSQAAQQMFDEGQGLLRARITETENNKVQLTNSTTQLKAQQVKLTEIYTKEFKVDRFAVLQELQEQNKALKIANRLAADLIKKPSIIDVM